MSSVSSFSILPLRSPSDVEIARQLFTEYIDGLGVDLSFQHVDVELADLPGDYAPPAGVILIAWDDARAPVGCVALRPRPAPATCEIKRLYVRPAARGRDLGRRLAQAVIAHARALGYERVVLDTLAAMTAAQGLYASLGFREIDAYYENPMPGTVYMALDISSAG